MDNGDYSTTYVSGAQCEVFIGNYLVDEAAEIEAVYSLRHEPIYGYASAHFNSVAHGRVRVSGVLIINYRFDGYLYAYIKAYKEALASGKNPIDVLLKHKIDNYKEANNTYGPKTIDDTEASLLIDGRDYDPNSATDKEARQAFRDLFWDQETKERTNMNQAIRPEFKYGPFNIKIKDNAVGYDNADFQTKEIINCFLNQFATVRRIDGAPSVEVYSFIAQTIL